jgi:hypothetical protein
MPDRVAVAAPRMKPSANRASKVPEARPVNSGQADKFHRMSRSGSPGTDPSAAVPDQTVPPTEASRSSGGANQRYAAAAGNVAATNAA